MEIKRNGSPAVIDLTGKDYRLIIPSNEAPSEEGEHFVRQPSE